MKILNFCWRETLTAELHALIDQKCDWKITFAGVGQETNGDDAVGIHAIQKVMDKNYQNPRIQLIITGSAPENHTSRILNHQPDVVVWVDAAQIGQPSGTIALIPEKYISGFRTSTHTLPLDIISKYLVAESHCVIRYLGIQPESTDFLSPISQQACAAASKIAAYISSL